MRFLLSKERDYQNRIPISGTTPTPTPTPTIPTSVTTKEVLWPLVEIAKKAESLGKSGIKRPMCQAQNGRIHFMC